MRILVVFTGGTIGCSVQENEKVLNVLHYAGKHKRWQDYFLLQYYKEQSVSHNKEKVEFDVIEPLQVLSENMIMKDWEILIHTFKKIDFVQYDGIVITHGTDTLAYTASFLGVVMQSLDLPIVLVSANYHLYHIRSNGHKNFEDAIDFICNERAKGVYVVFSYEKEKSVVYLGTRIKQSYAFIDRYESVDGIDFGYIENGEFVKNPKEILEIEEINQHVGINFMDKIKDLNKSVLLIKPYVNMNYNWISLEDENIKAVLHETYHSCTACVKDENSSHSILYFQNRCHGKNIQMYAAPFQSFLEEQDSMKYSSTNSMLQAGINPISNMTLESAYAKLILSVNLYDNVQEWDRFLRRKIFFEKIE